jgi:AraC-like DNA-binding protein
MKSPPTGLCRRRSCRLHPTHTSLQPSDTRSKLWEKYHRQVTLGPAQITLASTDERFLKRLTDSIEQHVSEAEYDTEALARDMCMSRMQLNRKLHALTGHPTHELVRQYRLHRAAQLLQKHAGNVSEVAFESGFNSLSHFTRAFRDQFGVLPSEYKRKGPDKPDRSTPGHT